MVLFLTFMLLASCYSHGTFVTTNITTGRLRGYRISTSSEGHLDIFLGIPFAESPLGNLRFAPPQEKRSWRPNVLNATSYGPACPQPLHFLQRYSFGKSFSDVNEDCLYLNVYSPKNVSSPDQLLPVMLWIHGGSFRYGSGSEYDGRILAAKGDVIVVTINYRLGALGFLSTDDSITSGNQGLLDQVMALKWVNRNIQYFGGNPNQVTLFGQSAGGAAVSLHIFSRLSEGLFQAVIAQSGCALSPFSVYRPPHSVRTTTRNLALMLHCPVNSSQFIVDCLKEKPATEIVLTHPQHPDMIAAFAPRVDGYFLHDTPENLLQRGEYNHNIRVMTGFVPNESADEIPNNFNANGGYNVTEYNSLVTSWSRRFLNSDHVKSAITCFYRSSENDDQMNVQTYMQMKSDYGYTIPHIQMSAQLNHRGTNTWLYAFNYRSQNYPEPSWMGIIHASELYYLFGTPLFQSEPCPGDQNNTCPQIWTFYKQWNNLDMEISKKVIHLWSSFAKMTGSSDTSMPLPIRDHWNIFGSNKQYLVIGNYLDLENDPKHRALPLWNRFNYLDYYANPSSHCHELGGPIVG